MTVKFREAEGTPHSHQWWGFSIFFFFFFLLYFLFYLKTQPGLFLTQFHFFQAVACGSHLFQAISFSLVSGFCIFAPQKPAAVGKVFFVINNHLKIETQTGKMSC